MFFSKISIEDLLGGSLVSFRKRNESGSGSLRQQKLQETKVNTVGDGIRLLRRFRAAILSASDPVSKQELLKSAHTLADKIADFCLADAVHPAAPLKGHSIHNEIQLIESRLERFGTVSRHKIPPNTVARNLRSAAEDIVTRLEEVVESPISPSKKLNLREMTGILKQFTIGTNCLTDEGINSIFKRSTTVAALLSGGLVYALIAKKIAERYGSEPVSNINVIAVAIGLDKETIFEDSPTNKKAKKLVIVDDMINTGNSVCCAADAAEEIFVDADILCKSRISKAGGRIPPSKRAALSYLSCRFQDFADLLRDGDQTNARVMFVDASEYAKANDVELPTAWNRWANAHLKGVKVKP